MKKILALVPPPLPFLSNIQRAVVILAAPYPPPPVTLRCKDMQYYSKEHQKLHWKFHKKICVAPHLRWKEARSYDQSASVRDKLERLLANKSRTGTFACGGKAPPTHVVPVIELTGAAPPPMPHPRRPSPLPRRRSMTLPRLSCSLLPLRRPASRPRLARPASEQRTPLPEVV